MSSFIKDKINGVGGDAMLLVLVVMLIIVDSSFSPDFHCAAVAHSKMFYAVVLVWKNLYV